MGLSKSKVDAKFRIEISNNDDNNNFGKLSNLQQRQFLKNLKLLKKLELDDQFHEISKSVIQPSKYFFILYFLSNQRQLRSSTI